jgi:predicted HAD superfamily Cof-like phosphohydrolase
MTAVAAFADDDGCEQMGDHYARVRQFMEGASQQVPDRPTIPAADIRILRVRLMLEEVLEVAEALGVTVRAEDESAWYKLTLDKCDIQADGVPDLVEAAKELADLSVVGPAGTAAACGIDLLPVLEAVDRNNLGKIEVGHKDPATGKWLKPPGYPKPDIASIIRAQQGAAAVDEMFSDDD